jgi:hypothetical protein
MSKEIKPHRYDIFQHFAQNHNLTLLESEIEDICQVVNRQLCEEKMRLLNEIAAAKQDAFLAGAEAMKKEAAEVVRTYIGGVKTGWVDLNPISANTQKAILAIGAKKGQGNG